MTHDAMNGPASGQTIGEWLAALGSAAPAPGGGAAAAMSACLSAALVEMVCRLTIGKPAVGEPEAEVTAIRDAAYQLRRRALRQIDADAVAFTALLAAYRLPRDTAGQQAARGAAIPVAGRRAVVVGRSTVVGKPTALLLLAADATVTVCHSRTPDLPGVCRTADILVAAAGRPGLIGAAHIGPGAVVIDVGTSATGDGGLTGDVDAEAAGSIASALTPVPGGVGPVTTAQLMRHTVRAALTASVEAEAEAETGLAAG